VTEHNMNLIVCVVNRTETEHTVCLLQVLKYCTPCPWKTTVSNSDIIGHIFKNLYYEISVKGKKFLPVKHQLFLVDPLDNAVVGTLNS